MRIKFLDENGIELKVKTIRGDPADLMWLADCLERSVKVREYCPYYLYPQPKEVPMGELKWSEELPSKNASSIGIRVNIIPDEEDD